MRQNITPELARRNWFALCDMAEVVPDTRKSAQELLDRLRASRKAHWTVDEIQRWMDEYEETL